MSLPDGMDPHTRANMLVRQLVDEHDPKYGVGSLTCSVYDTAWVAMIAKQTPYQPTRWLFPSALDYLLKSQRSDGGWHTSSSEIDAILNTLAASLALCRHIAAPHQLLLPPREDLQHRQRRAVSYLEASLSEWNVAATTHAGFEILVPKLLQLLAVEGVEFNFPGLATLHQLKAKTAAKFNASLLYGTVRSSAARSLEGLIGEIDFDRVSQHRISGSIMASPASTAAYLMHASTWDDDAEAYLTHVLSVGDERSLGGVPSQYPTTVFEVTHCLSVLLANGFYAEELGIPNLENAGDFLEACLILDAGVTGSAPYIESDADNTAKALTTLCQLGRTPNPQGLVVRFETRGFFKTFTQERSPTFRTNCLVLKALLDLLPGNSEQAPQIEKTVRFIANLWWTTNGEIEDQSNTSLLYPTMLMVDAFIRLVNLWEDGFAPVLDDLPLRDKVFICLYQALTRTLQDQNTNGSWGRTERCETTAYAVLILTKLASLSSAPRVKAQLLQAIDIARKFLSNNCRPHDEPDRVWQGKTTAGSSLIFQAYVLAALQALIAKPLRGRSVESRFEMSLARIAIQTKYYSRQSWFANVPEWQIQACLVESNLFLPQLNGVRFAVFPRDHLQDDEHFNTIPFTWLAASNFDRRFIGPEYLYQMMILSFLNRQLDDFVRNTIADTFAGCLFEVEDILEDVFDELEHSAAKDRRYCDSSETIVPRSSVATSATASMMNVRAVLHRFISHVLHHPYVLMASHHDQDHLRSELQAFLLGRIDHLSDQPPAASSAVGSSTKDTAGDQTNHTYTFSFLACLVGNQTLNGPFGIRRDFLETPEQQYLAAAMCKHLSVVSFMSSSAKDQPFDHVRDPPTPVKSRISSFGMDRHHSRSNSTVSSSSSSYSEGGASPVSDLSSNSSAPSVSPSSEGFPKMSKQRAMQSHAQTVSQSLQLTRLLTHERSCLNVCLQSLDAAGINQRTANTLGLFVDLSELSGLIFRDANIGSLDQPTTEDEAIEEPCILQPPPMPPKKSAQRGSIARTALKIESPSTGRNPSNRGIPPSDVQPFETREDNIQITGITSSQRDWNTSRLSTAPSNRRASRSSIEMCRIERIMTHMGDSASRTTLPKPKVNPMLKQYPQTRPRAATEGESVYKLAKRPTKPDAQKRVLSTISATDPETLRLARVRAQTQKRGIHASERKAVSEKQAREAEEFEFKRRRASALQAKAMAEAAREVSVSKEPMPKREPTLLVRAETTRDVESKTESYPVGIRSPPPESSEDAAQAGKMYRAPSRFGGPRLRLPF